MVLRGHWAAIEADLQHHYGVDLLDLWRGTLSLRKLRVLLTGLPADCPTSAAFAQSDLGDLAGWSLTDVLLGRVADELALMRWEWEAAHIDPKKTRHRDRPPAVLPSAPTRGPDPERAPVVSPHALGAFVNEDLEVAG